MPSCLHCLSVSCLQLHKHLMENKTFEMVRAPVALAIVKLLLRLPPQVLHLEFPRLLTVLCNQVCISL